jgi:hypothetical protein
MACIDGRRRLLVWGSHLLGEVFAAEKIELGRKKKGEALATLSSSLGKKRGFATTHATTLKASTG